MWTFPCIHSPAFFTQSQENFILLFPHVNEYHPKRTEGTRKKNTPTSQKVNGFESLINAA